MWFEGRAFLAIRFVCFPLSSFAIKSIVSSLKKHALQPSPFTLDRCQLGLYENADKAFQTGVLLDHK